MFVVIDTNHFREFAHGSPLGARLRTRIGEEQVDVFTTIVTAEEALSGWIALVRRHRAGLAQLSAYEHLRICIETVSNLASCPSTGRRL